jgi:endonuclease/exonuclease/phosphatase family metal-dependent hydrolase
VRFRAVRLLYLFCVVAVLTGCSGGHTLARLDGVDPPPGGAITWYSPAAAPDRSLLARWRASVGTPVIRPGSRPVPASIEEIAVVSWNAAFGDGDIVRLVQRARSESPARPLVLLLQEVYRRGGSVPRRLVTGAGFARRFEGASDSGSIDSVAARLGMFVYYVPSMRNGASGPAEDRGNAILSDLPLSHLEAIELPFEKQRRVAVSAVVEGTTREGREWRLRVVSAHLDNSVPRRAWIASEYGRARQARGLVALLRGDVPTVLGGDFNTWFGFSDQAFLETALAFPQTPTSDTRATFRGLLRLDHFFCRLPPGWRVDAVRGDDRFGSDHSPLVGAIHIG